MRRLFRVSIFAIAIAAIAIGGLSLVSELKRPVEFSAANSVVGIKTVDAAASQLRQENEIKGLVERVRTDKAFGPVTSRCMDIRIDGRAVASFGETKYLVPASGVKLLTAHAALAKLSNDARQETALYGSIDSSGVASDLILIGNGDPFLSTKSFQQALESKKGTTSIDSLVQTLEDKNVKSVSGPLKVDDSLFDDVRRVSGWSNTYGAAIVSPIGALLVNQNHLTPTSQASPTDPAIAAGEAFKKELNDAGITVNGAVVRSKTTPTTGKLASVHAATLTNQIGRILRESDNTGAEVFIKLLGARAGKQGTTANGLVEAQKTYSDLETGTKFQQTDGSGLSVDNKMRCATLLDAYLKLPEDVKSQLSVAGESGTLKDRLNGTYAAHNLRAKTGTLNGASSLTGELQTRGGVVIQFSTIANGLANETIARQWQDAIATQLSEVR